MADRTPREAETREETSRTEEWNPASLLPDPEPMDGFVFKWVRKSVLGDTDVMNMSRRRREGYSIVTKAEQPSLADLSDSTEHIEVGGLVLCKLPKERAEARRRHFDNLARQQLDGLSGNFRREAGEDRRMPLEEQRQTKVSRSPQ
jgi:hypothetical protein